MPDLQPISFHLGSLVATPNAIEVIPHDEILSTLVRHAIGDWGDVCDDDKRANDLALKEGTRLLSAFRSATSIKFWIITEADRSLTTVLLPSDY